MQRGRDAVVLPPPDFREDQIQEQKGKCFTNVSYCNLYCTVDKEAPGPPQPFQPAGRSAPRARGCGGSRAGSQATQTNEWPITGIFLELPDDNKVRGGGSKLPFNFAAWP